MPKTIGIMAPTLHRYERRVVLSPVAVKQLVEMGYPVMVQLSPIRIFPASAYREAGAEVVSELGDRPDVIFNVKQVPTDFFRPNKIYVFFSHVIKGQPGNMHMLNTMMQRGVTLIDYERMVRKVKIRGKEREERVIAFSYYAGMAGITDTLNLLGLRLEALGTKPNPFSNVKQTLHYDKGAEEIKAQLKEIGDAIRRDGLPKQMEPLVIGFLGYGRVAKGALEVFDALQPKEITPQQLLEQKDTLSRYEVYKVIFKEEHTVIPKDPGQSFDLDDYYDHPSKYNSDMMRYLPHLTALVNGIFWNSEQPQMVTRENFKTLLEMQGRSRLVVVGDISCDINGGLACTVDETTVQDPYFVYDPFTGKKVMGWVSPGMAVNAVGTAPSELPLESSNFFSSVLLPLVPGIVDADYQLSYELGIQSLPEVVRPAVILWNGEITPPYAANAQMLEGLRLHGSQPFYHDW